MCSLNLILHFTVSEFYSINNSKDDLNYENVKEIFELVLRINHIAIGCNEYFFQDTRFNSYGILLKENTF